MTIGGAISELNNLLKADDIPSYYKPSIQKITETIELEQSNSDLKYYPPCEDCHTKMDEIRRAYDRMQSNSDSDCISREQAIRIAEQGQLLGYEWQFKELCKLPPVTPKPKTDALDKIRAKIQKYADNKAEPTEMRAYYHCLQIIDKYTAESEDKE